MIAIRNLDVRCARPTVDAETMMENAGVLSAWVYVSVIIYKFNAICRYFIIK